MSRDVFDDHDFVYRAPQAGRPHVVLLPGLIAGEWMWRPTMDALANVGCGYVAPTEPFAGAHDRVGPLKQWVVDLMDHCSIGSAVMVGGSFGSRVALDCAIAFPERVDMLVLSGAPGSITTAQMGISFQGSVTRSIGTKVVRQLFFDPACVSDAAVAETLRIFGERRRLLNLIRLMKESSAFDYDRALAAVDAFVLMIWGLDDKISLWETWNRLAASARHGALHAIERCGHLPMIERPDVFNAILLEHLEPARIAARA
jgi:2-hydroxy-6-oxonona-2,4-dienedioate hydrolase